MDKLGDISQHPNWDGLPAKWESVLGTQQCPAVSGCDVHTSGGPDAADVAADLSPTGVPALTPLQLPIAPDLKSPLSRSRPAKGDRVFRSVVGGDQVL